MVAVRSRQLVRTVFLVNLSNMYWTACSAAYSYERLPDLLRSQKAVHQVDKLTEKHYAVHDKTVDDSSDAYYSTLVSYFPDSKFEWNDWTKWFIFLFNTKLALDYKISPSNVQLKFFNGNSKFFSSVYIIFK